MKWISVDDQMPIPFRMVLMCWDGWGAGRNYRIHDVDEEELETHAPYVGYWDGKKWRAFLAMDDLDDACYWLYIPESPPNGETKWTGHKF